MRVGSPRRTNERVEKSTARDPLPLLDALSDPYPCFLDQSSPSRSWLVQWDLTEEVFFRELCEDIRTYEIFLKPKNKSSDSQKYQTRLIYTADPPDYPQERNIHITLSPKGEPPRVKVAIHPSDTARQLPKTKIAIKSQKS